MVIKKIRFILALISLIISSNVLAHSLEKCLIKPKDLGMAATFISKQHQKNKKSFPPSAVVQSTLIGSLSSDEKKSGVDATYEAFIRIESDGQFSLIPIPLFTVDLSSDRDVIYVCAHEDIDSSQTFVEIYFLKGYRLGDASVGAILGDMLFNSVKVEPVSINPIGFDKVQNIFSVETEKKGDFSIINTILSPLRLPFNLLNEIQSALMSTLDSVLPVGVERIHVDEKKIVLSSGVDLENPQNSTYNYTIPLQ